MVDDGISVGGMIKVVFESRVVVNHGQMPIPMSFLDKTRPYHCKAFFFSL